MGSNLLGIGTPGYMPPELADDMFDPKSDIYAFGMCALEMFTFKFPYGECATSYQIFAKQLKVSFSLKCLYVCYINENYLV